MTDLQTENERLKASNRKLAQQLMGMSDRLEEGRRELLATGWDAAVAAMTYTDGSPVELAANMNPYRKPVIDLSGEIFCKVDDK